MALKKPLVLNGGDLEELQSGDDLDAPIGGGDVSQLVNANAGAIAIGSPVYASAAGSVDLARANVVATSRSIGLVKDASIASSATGGIITNGKMEATTGQWDTAFGTTGGLTAGTVYYLSSATAGRGVVTAPTGSGNFVVPLGIALSTTEFLVRIGSPIKRG